MSTRRDFLKSLGLAALGATVAPSALVAAGGQDTAKLITWANHPMLREEVLHVPHRLAWIHIVRAGDVGGYGRQWDCWGLFEDDPRLNEKTLRRSRENAVAAMRRLGVPEEWISA